MSEHAPTEMRIWLGFSASFVVAFVATIFIGQTGAPGETVEIVWALAMALGYINHGIWHRYRGTAIAGVVGVVSSLIILFVQPALSPLAWIATGLALAASGFAGLPATAGHSRTHALIGVYVTLGGVIRTLSVYLPTVEGAEWLVWLVVVGLVFITLGRSMQNPINHYMGAGWILVAVVTFAFYPPIMFVATALTFAIGMIVNIIYLSRVLGRTPKIGEIISFASRALVQYGLKRPIDQYRVIVILIKGNIGAEDVTRDLLARLEPRCAPILLLGPTAPMQLSLPDRAKVAWVTDVSGVSNVGYPVLSPEDPTAVNVFLARSLDALPKDAKPVILGDFLDNMIPYMDESLFYKYYSDQASATRVSGRTLIPIVNVDIHREVDISVVKRFADVIIENREREERGRLIREVRVSNRVDEIHTDWERY